MVTPAGSPKRSLMWVRESLAEAPSEQCRLSPLQLMQSTALLLSVPGKLLVFFDDLTSDDPKPDPEPDPRVGPGDPAPDAERRDPCDRGPSGLGTNIEYFPLERAPGTNSCRATGAVATLTLADVRDERVDPTVTPDGYNHLSMNPARGHLIASVYGGEGDLLENFIPMYQIANQLMYNTIEQRILKSPRKGGRVEVTVIPVYNGPDPLIPSSVIVHTRGDLVDDCRIENTLTPNATCASDRKGIPKKGTR
jgi:hypothetical protein